MVMRTPGRLLLLLLLAACAPDARPWDASLLPAGRFAATARPFELSVLSYNTHGLKQPFAEDDPEQRFPAIARLLNGYDVALLQEDFAYHAIIQREAEHPIRLRGNGQARNPLVDLLAPFACGDCGAGLSTLVALDESALLQDYREPYQAYNGWFEGSHDAWVTKGFLTVRIRLPNGSILDVYNTHLDAGKRKKRKKDYAARRRQLGQLRAAMEQFSHGVAVILGGDFNFRVGRRRSLDAFAASLALNEVEVDLADRWRSPSDYLFYRSSDDVEIRLGDAGEAREFVDAEGNRLSDHAAIYARFRIRATGS